MKKALISGAQIPIVAEIADTDESRTIGLSGRSGLSEGTGMLFAFPRPGYYRFWMPDMRFSIDMLWLDEDFTVVHIASDVSPETYPRVFVSEVPASYVLELPAGGAIRYGIATGTPLRLEN